MENIELLKVRDSLKTQDNRCTDNPMFCVQEKVVVTGMDPAWTDEHKYLDPDDCSEVDSGFPGAVKTGYIEYWKTVMVAFTEEGCKEYIRQNGHNLNEPRIYVESFNRCPEMISIRKTIMELNT